MGGRGKSRAVPNAKKQPKQPYIDWLFITLIVFYSLGLKRFKIPTDIDQTYQWILTNAIENGGFLQGDFLGTYGPLGFLDFRYSQSLVSEICSISWTIFVYVFFAISLRNLLTENKFLDSRLSSSAISAITILTLEPVITPSILLIITFILNYTRVKSELNLAVMVVMLPILYYLKLLPFVLTAAISFFYFLELKRESSRTSKHQIRLTVLTILALSTIFVSAANSGLRKWTRGYLDSLVGYSAMAGHDPKHFWMLLLYVCLSLLVWLGLPKKIELRLLFLFTTAVLLNYGFTRADVLHITPAFLFLLAWSFSINRGFAATRLRIAVLTIVLILDLVIIYVWSFPKGLDKVGFGLSVVVIFLAFAFRRRSFQKSILALAVVSFMVVGNVSPFGSLGRLFSNDQKEQNISMRIEDSVASLKELMNVGYPTLNPSLFTQSVAEELSSKRGVVISTQHAYLPWLFFNSEFLPVPMLFGGFTPWLDNQNVNYLDQNRIDYVIMEKNTSIDGNSWASEAPATTYYIFCNFIPEWNRVGWLLLRRLPESRCAIADSRNPDSKSAGKSEFVKVVTINPRNTIPGLEILSLKNNSVKLRGGGIFQIQPRNSSGILLQVPENLDYPKPWNINQNLTFLENETIKSYTLPLK